MRKVIAAMNVTLDGYCDHTAMTADDEIHLHYNDLLRSADILVYGRTTYQMMESYWPTIVNNPTGNQSIDEFAILIENISKIVFSHTLKNAGWTNAKVAMHNVTEEISPLKQQPGKDIVVGSPSLIVACVNHNLLDELQLMVHPVIAGNGLPLFKNINDRINLTLLKTKVFSSGAIGLYYKPAN